MNLIKLIEVYPFRWLISSYIVFCFLVSVFISVYSNHSFLLSIILVFLYNIFFFLIAFTILFLLYLKVIIHKKSRFFIYFLAIIFIILFGKLYEIDEKFYQSLTSISTMQKDLESGYFKFVGNEYKFKMGRVKDLMTSNIPFALNDNNETVILSCELFNHSCTDVAQGTFYNHRNFVKYYDQGNNHYLMFKAISKKGEIVDYTEKYINIIKFQQSMVIGYLTSALFMVLQVFNIFRRMNNRLTTKS